MRKVRQHASSVPTFLGSGRFSFNPTNRGAVGVSGNRGPTGRAAALVAEAPEPHVWFCAYCGRRGAPREEPDELERVCSVCGFGLLLEALTEVAPMSTDAFLVVGDRFKVEAISHHAEELLGVPEQSVVRHPLTDLLVPADPDGQGVSQLIDAVTDATSGVAGVRPSHLLLRPTHDPELRLHARVGRCGPPLGALIVLEPTEAERLHLLEHH